MYRDATIVMMEDHDKAFHAWREARLQSRILVHLDPHIDFGWILDENPREMLNASSWLEVESLLRRPTLWNFQGRPMENGIHIGNYIYPAMKEKIVRAFYWVVPDGMMQTQRDKKEVCRFFLNLKQVFPERVENLYRGANSVGCLLDGVPTVACALENLPPFSENVLLDIDTDYFIIPRFKKSYPHFDPDATQPWLRPENLVEKLRAKKIRSDFITIAYSVDGGYTPLEYKHLGDELKNCLQQTHEERRAPLHFAQARLCQAQGDMETARRHYLEAIREDPAYASAWNNFGPVYLSLKKWGKSLEAFQAASLLDPDNPNPLCGLGHCLARGKKWGEAGGYYARTLRLNPGLEEARFGLALSLSRRKRWQESLETLNNEENFKEYRLPALFLKGRIHRKMGQRDQAVSVYEEFLRSGGGGAGVHWRLGFLYLGQKRFYKAWRRFQAIGRLFFYSAAGFVFYRPRNFIQKWKGYALAKHQAG